MTVPRGNVQGLGRASRGPGRTGGLELEVERTSKDIEGQYVKSQDMDSDSKRYQKIQQVQSIPIPIYSNNRCRIRLIQAPIQADSRTACRNGPTGTREALPIKGQEHRGTSPVTPVMGSEIGTMET
jgi:hypothetical protein